MTTEDYITLIEDRKKSKQTVKNVDWSQMPEGIDKARVADALSSGLDETYASEIKRRFTTNQPINNLDYSKVKFSEGSSFSPGRVAVDAIRSSVMAPQVLMEGAERAANKMGEVAGPPVKSAVNKIAEVVKPNIEPAMRVMGRPEFQPLKPGHTFKETVEGTLPFKFPTGEPLKDVMSNISATLSFPLRMGATLQEPQVLVQGATTDALLKRGVNPFVAYASGMVAGVAADPLTLMSVSEIGMAYGMERAASIKARQSLKSSLAQMDVERATALAKFSEEASISQAQDLAAQESKLREMMGGIRNPEKTGSAGTGPMKQIAIPKGEPREITLKTETGPEVPQYDQTITDVKIPWRKNLLNKSVLGMEERRPVAGKTVYEPATLMPEETRLKVPEKYEPTRPETREIPRAEGIPPDIEEPGGVFGEPVREPAPAEKDIYQQLAESVSHETEHLPPTESSSYYPPNAPAKLVEWMRRSSKELGDLRFAQEVAAPTENRTKDLWGTIRRYAGHQELSRSDAEHMMYEMADYIPDASRRTLITLYADLGRAPTLEDINILRKATAGAKMKDVKRLNKALEGLMDQNLNLVDQEGAALDSYVGYFKEMGEHAQKFHLVTESPEKALIPRLRERYGGPHLYVAKEEAEKGLFRRLITGKTRFAKPREFDNMVEAAKEGWIPKTMDSAELLGIYHNGVNKAASQRFLMNALEKQGLINWEGEGAQIRGFQPSARMLEKNLAGETKKTLYTKTASSPFPEVQRAMRSIAEDQWQLYDNSWFPAMEKINRGVKMFNLYLQVFHPKALAAEAISKGYSPAKFMEGLKMIDKNPEYVRSMIRNGLIINDSKDIGREIIRQVANNYKGPNPLKLIQKAGDAYTDWVFRRYMTGLKVYNSNVMIRRFTEMGVTPSRAIELAVEDSNRIFGGLNLGGMARSENMQRIFRLVAFAPDWTESKLRQMGGFAGMGFGPDISAMERSILTSQTRKYWVNMTALAATTHLAAQVNPFDRVISIDLSQETGFKDVKKLAMLAGMNPIYFTSKMSPLFRDIVTISDPHMRFDQRMKKVAQQSLPIYLQPTGGLTQLLSDEEGP